MIFPRQQRPGISYIAVIIMQDGIVSNYPADGVIAESPGQRGRPERWMPRKRSSDFGRFSRQQVAQGRFQIGKIKLEAELKQAFGNRALSFQQQRGHLTQGQAQH